MRPRKGSGGVVVALWMLGLAGLASDASADDVAATTTAAEAAAKAAEDARLAAAAAAKAVADAAAAKSGGDPDATAKAEEAAAAAIKLAENAAARSTQLTAAAVTASRDADAETAASGDVTTAKTVTATVPQVVGLRDGTLGIPANGGAAGLQAALDSKISEDGAETDAFARLGGLTITPRFSVEFAAETYQSSIPRALLDGTPVVPRILPTDMAAVGFRIRFQLKPSQWRVDYGRPGKCETTVVAGASDVKNRAASALTCDDGKQVQAFIVERTAEKTSGWTLSAGGRFITRSSTEADGVDSRGVAGEVSVQYGRQTVGDADNSVGFNLFASLSGFHIGRAEDRIGPTVAIFPEVDSWRFTVGAEVHATVSVKDQAVVPRLGFYATVARNRWTNEFATGAMERSAGASCRRRST